MAELKGRNNKIAVLFAFFHYNNSWCINEYSKIIIYIFFTAENNTNSRISVIIMIDKYEYDNYGVNVNNTIIDDSNDVTRTIRLITLIHSKDYNNINITRNIDTFHVLSGLISLE